MTRPADWIFTDARIWPGGPPGSQEPSGEATPDALAIREGRIAGIGRADDIMNFRGPDTAIFPLGGRFVMPGFVDAHIHLLTGGARLFRVDLRGVGSRQEFTQRIADRARTTPPGRWILGGDWNQEEWGGEFPDRSWIDQVTPKHPVFLQRMDLHLALANSVALDLAGIGPETEAPVNGRIDRDPGSGRISGILRERAMLPVYDAIPDLSDEDVAAAMRAGVLAALTRGITQVHDMGAVHKLSESWQGLRVLGRLDVEGRLPIRVKAALPISHWRRAADLVEERGPGGGRLRWGGVKAFVDGSFGSSTAWFYEPYLGTPENRGGPVCDLDVLAEDIEGALGAGLEPVVHSIGDRANDWLVDLCDRLDHDRPGFTRALRIEHAQHLSSEAIAAIGRAGRIVSVQPLHLLDDAPWIPSKIGDERGARSYAFRSLLDAGARMALGSDWPVASMDPLGTLSTALTRRLADGPGPNTGESWNPQERLDLDRALRAHTYGGAAAGGWESMTGSLEPGKFGDFIVLSENPFDCSPQELKARVKVDMTFVDGILVHSRDGSVP